MLKSLSNAVLARLPGTKLVPDDGTVILSIEDVHRRRMFFISLFGLVVTSAYSVLQVITLGFESTALFNIITGALGAAICFAALRMSLWGDRPEPFLRFLLLGFSSLLWLEICMSGGITGYHVAIFPVLPVVAALLLSTRDTLAFTAINLVVIVGLAWVKFTTDFLPVPTMPPETGLLLSTIMIMVAVVGCGGGALVMAYQNERIESQLRELVDYQSHLAAHDHLSGLGNRMRLQQHFDDLQQGETFDLLLIDLDGFKAVNDTFGHNAGDFLITALSQRLREVTDETDLLVRLGGDEFVILLENVDGTLASVRNYAEYLIDIISRPYRWNKNLLRISASIGHARYPMHGNTPSKVLSLADKALYIAKNAGKHQCVTHGNPPQNAEQPKLKRRHG